VHAQTDPERAYTRAHVATRVVVEKAFGVCKQRFRAIHKSGGVLTYAPEKCCKIIVACMILHNMCMDAGIPLEDDDDLPREEDEDEEDRIERPLLMRNNNRRGDGWNVRQRLIQERFT
jgi:hypothetical protein